MRKILQTFVFFSLIAAAVPSFSQIRISVNFGPPPLRHEVRSAPPSPGWIWISGYYAFNDGRRDYDWVPGRWEAPPSPHHVWVAPRYRRIGNHYDYYQGQWKDRGRKPGKGPGPGKGKGR